MKCGYVVTRDGCDRRVRLKTGRGRETDDVRSERRTKKRTDDDVRQPPIQTLYSRDYYLKRNQVL